VAKPELGSHVLVYDANDNPLYEGWAVRKGADTAVAVWRIKRYTWTAGTGGEQVMTEEAYANGNELFDNIWDNRAILTYVVAV
jgi:hypothetical protein